MKKPFSEVALQTRESLERPYFPLPLSLEASRSPSLKLPSRRENPSKGPIFLSILAGTNLIMVLIFIFFCNPRLIPEKIHPPFDFRENPCKIPKENQKNCFFFSPCVFWICSRGLFAFMTLDLNFTNPKSAIFELG